MALTFLLAWLAFPVVLGAVCLGCGLLLERLAGVRLSTALLPAAGFATAVVSMSFAVTLDETAELAVPLVVALAVAGLAATGLRGLRERFDAWAVAVAAAAYVVLGAPVLATGEPTFAGYVKLDDTATLLGMLDWTLEHGTRVAGLAPSTYEAMLTLWLGDGYPVGSLVPLGLTKLVGVDPAWTWQPYLSFLGAILAVGLYELAGEVVRSRPLRALTAVTAASSALLYGYALWGGVKELFAAALLVLLAATLPLLWRSRPRAAVVPAAASPVPLYWAGPKAGTRLEFSQVPGVTSFVRYLPNGTPAGDLEPHLTVATYARPNGFAEIEAASKNPKAKTIDLAGGGIAVYDPAVPTNVHLAYTKDAYQVEVFSPDAGVALRLVEKGAIRPVR